MGASGKSIGHRVLATVLRGGRLSKIGVPMISNDPKMTFNPRHRVEVSVHKPGKGKPTQFIRIHFHNLKSDYLGQGISEPKL